MSERDPFEAYPCHDRCKNGYEWRVSAGDANGVGAHASGYTCTKHLSKVVLWVEQSTELKPSIHRISNPAIARTT